MDEVGRGGMDEVGGDRNRKFRRGENGLWEGVKR